MEYNQIWNQREIDSKSQVRNILKIVIEISIKW